MTTSTSTEAVFEGPEVVFPLSLLLPFKGPAVAMLLTSVIVMHVDEPLTHFGYMNLCLYPCLPFPMTLGCNGLQWVWIWLMIYNIWFMLHICETKVLSHPICNQLPVGIWHFADIKVVSGAGEYVIFLIMLLVYSLPIWAWSWVSEVIFVTWSGPPSCNVSWYSKTVSR